MRTVWNELLTVIGWIIAPAVAALVGAWVYLNRRVADHDVRLERHNMQITALEEASRRAQETHRHIEELMREILQRLTRVEQWLEDIKQHLNGRRETK